MKKKVAGDYLAGLHIYCAGCEGMKQLQRLYLWGEKHGRQKADDGRQYYKFW